MHKLKFVVPVFTALTVGSTHVFGPHDPHALEPQPQEMPRLIGTLASSVASTATATVQLNLFLNMLDFK